MGKPEDRPAPGNRKACPCDVYERLRKACGIDFTFYKPTTVGRRIERRMSILRLVRLSDYLARLSDDRAEVNALYKDLLIGMTEFFRDPQAFARMEQVLAGLMDGAKPEDEIRVWVPGCATGEEVYSLAILLHEAAGRLGAPPRLKVFATDVHRESLASAAAGLFGEAALANVTEARRARYFARTADGFQIDPELRQMVVFAEHNVINDPPFTRIVLVSCRNLLIYFQPIAWSLLLPGDTSLPVTLPELDPSVAEEYWPGAEIEPASVSVALLAFEQATSAQLRARWWTARRPAMMTIATCKTTTSLDWTDYR